MELGGLEPPTSWVRYTSSAAITTAKSRRLAGISRGDGLGRSCVDSRGWPAIPVESGTLGDECLDQRGGRAPTVFVSARIETRRPRDPARRAARCEPARRPRTAPTTSAGSGYSMSKAIRSSRRARLPFSPSSGRPGWLLALVGLALRRSRQWSMASLARTRAAAARVHGRRFETSGAARLYALEPDGLPLRARSPDHVRPGWTYTKV